MGFSMGWRRYGGEGRDDKKRFEGDDKQAIC
jgi:hypothetical protein